MIKKIYEKHKEIIDYLFWGGVAFVLSMVLYWLFDSICGWNSVVANTVDWVICVLFTYVTNRIFVFRSKTKGLKAVGTEFIQFVAARLFTLVLEDLIIFIGVTVMGYNSSIGSMIVKLIGQVVAIVTNYILSKLWIFRKKNEDVDNHDMKKGDVDGQ